MMIPRKLEYGDTIGIISPCHIADKRKYQYFISGIERFGFKVKEGKNLYRNSYGYAASVEERLADFNEMILDDKVKMILFGGGNLGNEFITELDFELLKKYPKIICSYSNGSTLLNTIYLNTGIETYYGQFPGVFACLTEYDKQQFIDSFMKESCLDFKQNSSWMVLHEGEANGILIGGYSTILAMLVNHSLFHYNKEQRYIIFLENNEKFNDPGEVISHLSWIEQNDFITQIDGLLFGNYSLDESLELLDGLKRFGEKHQIPIIKCDDFGHGINHGILPIGRQVSLSSKTKTLKFIEK